MKKLSILLLAIFGVSLFGLSIEEKIRVGETHLLKYLSVDKGNFISWSGLFYYSRFDRKVDIQKKDNFVQKSLFEKKKLIQQARAVIFKDILTIDINNEITIKELIEISNRFQGHLTRKFFSPEILLPVGQAGYTLNISAYFPFTGNGNLIDLILKSGYFVEREKMETPESSYQPYAYNRLIIEARHLSVKPSLFPNIYSFDKNGEKILVYSLAHSNEKAIRQNGYVHFYGTSDEFELKNRKNYYCAALETSGTKRNDLVISREDYIKYFASPISLKRLSEGNLFIVVSEEKVNPEKKEQPRLIGGESY
jgi:hypothetical protein